MFIVSSFFFRKKYNGYVENPPNKEVKETV